MKHKIIIDENQLIDWSLAKIINFNNSPSEIDIFLKIRDLFSSPKIICASKKDANLIHNSIRIDIKSYDLTKKHVKISNTNDQIKNIYFSFTLSFVNEAKNSNVEFDFIHCPDATMIDSYKFIHGSPYINIGQRYNLFDVINLKTIDCPLSGASPMKIIKINNMYFSYDFMNHKIHAYQVLNEFSDKISYFIYYCTKMEHVCQMFYGIHGCFIDFSDEIPVLSKQRNNNGLWSNDDYTIWTIKEKKYYVFSNDSSLYIADVDLKCVDKIAGTQLSIVRIKWYISNTNELIIIDNSLDVNYIDKYLNKKFDSEEICSYVFDSLRNVKKCNFKHLIYFNENKKPCRYILDRKDHLPHGTNVVMNVGYTKTWFLCSLILNGGLNESFM